MNPESAHVPGKGKLLIARPFLQEAFFSNSVVLLLDTDSKGAIMGITLNVQTDLTLNDLIPQFDPKRKVNVFCGGPCDMERLFVLHTLGSRFKGSFEIFPGLYIGGRIEDIADYIANGGEINGKIRFFVGYSGWASNQLSDELDEKTWAVGKCPNPAELLSGWGIPFWRKQLISLGSKYRQWAVMPTEAELN